MSKIKLKTRRGGIVKKCVALYIISGVLIGLAWVALFYGYQNTSISSAIIIYNMCPIYVMIAAPFVLNEKLSVLQVCVICISFIGLVLIVGSTGLDSKRILGIVVSGVLILGSTYLGDLFKSKELKNWSFR